MVYPVFSVRDLKVGYGVLYMDSSEPAAIRNFSVQVNRDSVMSAYAKDFELFRIGSFDSETGRLSPVDPVVVASGYSVKVGDFDAVPF